jgi:twitching motility protein PilT
VDGVLIQTNLEKMTPDMCQRLIYSLLSDVQKQRFESENELDISFGIKGLGRVRMNVFRQRGSVGAALRSVPSRFMSFEELGLPPVINDVVNLPRGLVLVTGPTGSGKSTTLASLIDYINENRQCHIMTIEDPIEYLFRHKKSVINQREVGMDTRSFNAALRSAMREAPDVIMIGEIRDLSTMQAAIAYSETGHLCLSTYKHTNQYADAYKHVTWVWTSYRARMALLVKPSPTEPQIYRQSQ